VVLRVATQEFTYLSTSPAKIKFILGDARLSLEREVAAGQFSAPRQRFDILSIDAFSSDAIPVHLMTREALALSAQVIKPDGGIAFHVSSRFLDLAPVVAQISAAQAFEALEIDDDPRDFDLYSPSEWVLVSHHHAFLAQSIVAKGGHAVTPVCRCACGRISSTTCSKSCARIRPRRNVFAFDLLFFSNASNGLQ